jgi:hypothetical protein
MARDGALKPGIRVNFAPGFAQYSAYFAVARDIITY